jgi:DNA-binding transcriptional regulator YiaG
MSDKRYVATLERAMQLAGGPQQLAAVLGTTPDLLRKWLSGSLQPPINKYITALQLVMRSESTRVVTRP